MSHFNQKLINRLIARTMIRRRVSLRMSREILSEKAGISIQTLYSYETGLRLILASDLIRIAKALNTPLRCFFENIQPSLFFKLAKVRKTANVLPFSRGEACVGKKH